ncbi:DUF4218 domain-containing protein [Camponotus japonicus]
MSQIIRSRKLASQLSKKYFRYRIRKITNCHYLNKQNVNRARFQKDNDESDRRQSNETCEDGNNNAFHNIDNDNEEDESDSNNSDTSNVCGIIVENTNNFFDINNCEVENNEMEDFTTSHLAKWCRTLNVPMTHINVLLKDIRKHKCFQTVFPSDIRTILGTPTFTPIKSVPPGEYYHQGLISELVRILSKCNIEKVNLTLNIDGLPLCKSSGQQLWPILVSVAGVQGEIMVGAYCGYKKSDDINLFLEDFVSEVIYLINNGLEINNRLLPVRLQCISADTPAKSFLLSTKGHTGYDSCLKCFIHGKYVKNRVCFPGTNADLKMANNNTDYQDNDNIMQFIPHLDLVSDVVLDYMHVVCLGVTKKLLTLWTTGNNYYKLGQATKKRISNRLENSINMCMSLEFPRKPRSLEDLKYYKATEFRQFLLYIGPIVLQGLLDNDIYLNFLTLHVSLRILCMENASEEMIIYADKLLKNFNETFTILYGEENVSFNVHALLHLANDVRKHGPLDSFSVFRFENFLQKIKGLIRKPQQILSQLHRRYVEIHNWINVNKKYIRKNEFTILQESCHEDGPLLPDCGDPQYMKIVGFGFTLIADDRRDNCFLTYNGIIVILRNIAFNNKNNSLVLIGQYFTVVEDFYTLPCKSQLVGVYLASKLSDLKQWPLNGIIKKKCLCVPWKKNKNVIISLLHSHE